MLVAKETLNEIEDMDFDVIIGNPPYGKNANLAINFVDKITPMAKIAVWVLPKTMRKESTFRRLNKNIHLVNDVDNSNDTFDIGVMTCTQTWEVRDSERVDEFVSHTTEDFSFSTQNNCDIAVGRVGAGCCGKVYDDPTTQSPSSNYFLKVSSKRVTKKIRTLTEAFRETAFNTAGNPSLTKQELINIYVEA